MLGAVFGNIIGSVYEGLPVNGYDYNQTMETLRQLFKDCPKSSYRIIPETKEQCRFIARFIEEERKTNFPK